MLIALKPNILLLAQAPSFEILLFLLHFIQILLVLRHLFYMSGSFVFVDFIWKFSIFSKLLFFSSFLFSVSTFQTLPFFNLVHQLASIHILFFHLPLPLLYFPLLHSLFSLLACVRDVLIFHGVPYRVRTDITWLKLFLVAEEHIVIVFVCLLFDFFRLFITIGAFVKLPFLSYIPCVFSLPLSIFFLH